MKEKIVQFDIDSGHKESKNITDIVFTKMENDFSIEINCKNKSFKQYLNDTLIALKRMHQVDTEIKQNFKIIQSKESEDLKFFVKGNVHNVLEILKNYELISYDIIRDILKNGQIEKIVEDSKTYILPKYQKSDIFSNVFSKEIIPGSNLKKELTDLTILVTTTLKQISEKYNLSSTKQKQIAESFADDIINKFEKNSLQNNFERNNI